MPPTGAVKTPWCSRRRTERETFRRESDQARGRSGGDESQRRPGRGTPWRGESPGGERLVASFKRTSHRNGLSRGATPRSRRKAPTPPLGVDWKVRRRSHQTRMVGAQPRTNGTAVRRQRRVGAAPWEGKPLEGKAEGRLRGEINLQGQRGVNRQTVEKTESRTVTRSLGTSGDVDSLERIR